MIDYHCKITIHVDSVKASVCMLDVLLDVYDLTNSPPELQQCN